MKKANFFLFLVCFLGSYACKKETTKTENPPVPVDSVTKVAEMNQTLGWKIFNEEQRAKPNENVLISPLSIQTALFMANNGAKGNTLAQILDLMDCPDCSVADLNQLHHDLTTLLTEQSGAAKLTIANGFFYDQTRVTVKPPFLSLLADNYACSAENVDFNAEQAALANINGWVKDHTNQKIDKILERISGLDVAFLINALHFKADWATGFDPATTNMHPFKKADGSTVSAAFVNADRNFTFAQTAKYNLVDIPFKDSTYSISFIQPSANNTAADWHLNIAPDTWLGMYEGMQNTRAIVYFPKLKLAYDNDLIESLKTLGVKDAFEENSADFTDMGTAGRNIFINQIKHKAVLEVDEKGAEGAAVTSVGFGVTSIPPTFWFDRPFVLVLRHVPTNTLVFTGFVAKP